MGQAGQPRPVAIILTALEVETRAVLRHLSHLKERVGSFTADFIWVRIPYIQTYLIKFLNRSAAQSMRVAFLTLRGLVLPREIRQFGPTFRHRNKYRGASQ
jgi:hypothetical protein